MIELIEKNNEDENNKDNNNLNNKDNWLNMNFNVKIKKGNSENKFQELKKLYFATNKFDFSTIKNNNKYFGKNQTSNRNYNQNMNINYSKNSKISEDYKESNINYNSIPNYNRKNKNMIRIVNNSDNFKNIVDKIDVLEHTKKIYNSHLNLNEINKSRKWNKSNIGLFKSVSLDKPSKLRNMMDDVYNEINKTNSYSIRRNHSNQISNMKKNIKYSTLINRDNNNYGINDINSINQYIISKSKDLNFDDLLNLCSKRNLQNYFSKGKITF